MRTRTRLLAHPIHTAFFSTAKQQKVAWGQITQLFSCMFLPTVPQSICNFQLVDMEAEAVRIGRVVAD